MMPESIEELLKLINQELTDRGRVRMWRGQANINWPIHSTAYRRLFRSGREPTENNIKHYESNLLKQATHRGYRYMNGRELSDMELLARLQHHGAATRLVDATRNSFVALWFVVSSHFDYVGALIGIHTHFIGGYESLPDSRKYSEILKTLADRKVPFTWEPTMVSNRISAQRSQFIYSAVSDKNSGSLILPEKEGINTTMIIAINSELKHEIRKILIESFDIRLITLFPDLDGFCEANSVQRDVREMFRW